MSSSVEAVHEENGNTPVSPSQSTSGESSSTSANIAASSAGSHSNEPDVDAAGEVGESHVSAETARAAPVDAPDDLDKRNADDFVSALDVLKASGIYNVTKVWAPKNTSSAWCIEAESEDVAVAKARQLMAANKNWQAADVCVKRSGSGSFQVLAGTTILRGKERERFITLQIRHQYSNGRSRAMAVIAKEADLLRPGRTVMETRIELVTLDSIVIDESNESIFDDDVREFMLMCLGQYVEDPTAFAQRRVSKDASSTKMTEAPERGHRSSRTAAAKVPRQSAPKKVTQKKARPASIKSPRNKRDDILDEYMSHDESENVVGGEDSEVDSEDLHGQRPKRSRQKMTPPITNERREEPKTDVRNDEKSTDESPTKRQKHAEDETTTDAFLLKKMHTNKNSAPKSQSLLGFEQAFGLRKQADVLLEYQQPQFAGANLHSHHPYGFPTPHNFYAQSWLMEQQRRERLEAEMLQEMEWERQREKHRERLAFLRKMRDAPQYPYHQYF